jgi:AcrR family transcriptional regulator
VVLREERPVARRNDHSRDELRRMSLQAAEAILDEDGVGALSVRRIAQSIGYSHGTLYLVFRNLDGLLLELNGRTLDGLADALEEALQGHPPGRERLHALARAYLAFARRNTARWRLVFEHHLPEGEPTPAWVSSKVARGHALLDLALAGCGVPAGQRPSLGLALWCAIHGVTVLALDDKLVDPAGMPQDAAPVMARTVDAFVAAGTAPGAGEDAA